jgi:hypothetical protein
MKFGMMINYDLEHPKQAAATMLPEKKQCCQCTQSAGPAITASHATTTMTLPSII